MRTIINVNLSNPTGEFLVKVYSVFLEMIKSVSSLKEKL